MSPVPYEGLPGRNDNPAPQAHGLSHGLQSTRKAACITVPKRGTKRLSRFSVGRPRRCERGRRPSEGCDGACPNPPPPCWSPSRAVGFPEAGSRATQGRIMIVKERAGVLVWDASPLDRIRLLEEILQVALLLLGGAFPLIRASLGLLALVSGYGAGGLLEWPLALSIAPLFLSSLLPLSTATSLLRQTSRP